MNYFTRPLPQPYRRPIGPPRDYIQSRLVSRIAIAALALLFIVFVGPVEASVRQSCDWSKRGDNPFMLDVPSAVDVYTHIPKATRERLKKRMKARRYDEFAEIRRDKIVGTSGAEYGDLRFMHFGQGEICARIDVSRWKESDVERGLVYCEDGHCVIVPTVCRNVSLVTRTKAPPPSVALDIPPLEVPGGLLADLQPGTVTWAPLDDDGWRGRLSLTTLIGDPLPPVVVTPPPVDLPTPEAERPWGPIFTGWPFGWFVPVLWPGPTYSPPATTVEPVPGVNPPVFTFLPPEDGRMQIPPPIFAPPVATPASPADKWASSDGPSDPVAPVPEPGTWALMALGLALVASWARKSKTA